MRILHFSLGITRKGGLNKYANDLMLGQIRAGHSVSLLFPGGKSFFSLGTVIAWRKTFEGISLFELLNTVPVPLLYGIKDPAYILDKKHSLSLNRMEQFFEKVEPQVFHIHTLMGLPVELLEFLVMKGVKTVFTTHDYFGLCPKVNFIDHYGNLCQEVDFVKCAVCNSRAPSRTFLLLRNAKLILKFKGLLSVIFRFKIKDKKSFSSKKHLNNNTKVENYRYNELQNFYTNLLSKVDVILFNSRTTSEVYHRHISPANSELLSLSHANIEDKRQERIFNKQRLRLTFIGSLEPYKGFLILKKSLLKLFNEGFKNWSLDVWSNVPCGLDPDLGNIVFRGCYTMRQLDSVFSGTDLLIVPSICKETFGFVVLEALSRGVPVIVSDNVGAKDVIAKISPCFVFQNSFGLLEKLREILSNLDILNEYNKKILSSPWIFSFDEHLKQLERIYLK